MLLILIFIIIDEMLYFQIGVLISGHRVYNVQATQANSLFPLSFRSTYLNSFSQETKKLTKFKIWWGKGVSLLLQVYYWQHYKKFQKVTNNETHFIEKQTMQV